MLGNDMLPVLVVFGLDYTLWPFGVNKPFSPPFSKDNAGNAVDCHGKYIVSYEAVPHIFQDLTERQMKIAVVSRRDIANASEQLFHLFGFTEYISFKEIYPGVISTHFRRIQLESNIEYSDMLYFDDLDTNVREASKLGVYSIVADSGMYSVFVEKGIEQFQEWKLRTWVKEKEAYQREMNTGYTRWETLYGVAGNITKSIDSSRFPEQLFLTTASSIEKSDDTYFAKRRKRRKGKVEWPTSIDQLFTSFSYRDIDGEEVTEVGQTVYWPSSIDQLFMTTSTTKQKRINTKKQ